MQENIDRIRELCERHGVRRLFLVGSAVGLEFDPASSDVDFLVVFKDFERKGWDDPYFQLLAALESTLGRPVDLIEAHTVRNPYLIASLNRSKQVLYAA